jgi:lipoprotein-anchoring transpeptidase ErfK/SrfK
MTRIRLAVAFVVALMLTTLVIRPSVQAQNLGSGYIAPPFRAYFTQHVGNVTLGTPQTGMLRENSRGVQYFDKGRLEDHSAETTDPAWMVMRGRLTVELIEKAPNLQINGSDVTYGRIKELSATTHAPPSWLTGGVGILDDGTTFVPFDPGLRPTNGYIVPPYFWQYLQRSDLFPGGWLHDAGLPLSDIFPALVFKEGVPRQVIMQPFERVVLTYDALNPVEWQLEQGNIGYDYMVATGLLNRPQNGAKRIEISLERQWLYAYLGDELIFDAPVSTGKDDWETPIGSFKIFQKFEKTDMKGDDKERGEKWDVKDVPHAMYFREGGFAIHGTYWHNVFGTGARLSHGCVNLPLDAAAQLYEWAPLGTPVIVY